MTEQEFYHNLVKPWLKQWGDHCRIEDMFSSGIPDINYAISGRQGWLELKVIRSGKLHFEKFQLPWLLRRGRHTKDLWVLARGSEEIFLYDVPELLQAPKEKYRKWTVIRWKDLEPTVRGQHPWEEIKAALTFTS